MNLDIHIYPGAISQARIHRVLFNQPSEEERDRILYR